MTEILAFLGMVAIVAGVFIAGIIAYFIRRSMGG